MLDVLIIGGGIHGVHLAHRLLQRTPLTHDDIRILDPHDELLHEWRRCTRNCGMRYLRSPSVHHIDVDPFSLDRYAARPENRKKTNFIPPKDRPSVALFHRHCQMVIDNHRLASLHVRGRALEIHNRVNHLRVSTTAETIPARFVLLAPGMGEQPYWPPWAIRLKDQGARIEHVFDPGFRRDDLPAKGTVAVIGAGISGAQLALRFVEKRDGEVSLISRNKIHVDDFDFEPGWLGPKHLERFRRQSIDQRRQQILAARTKGSVPRDVKLALEKAMERNRLACIVDGISDATFRAGSTLLIGRQGQYECQTVVLATGFAEKRPGNGFMDQVIEAFDLKTAACGFPVTGPALDWHARIFVTGPLSELQIGPSARNIAGSRHAGRRITDALNNTLISGKTS